MFNYKVLQYENPNDTQLLESMFRLRHDVFHKELGWSVGLNIKNDMETDQYDRPGTYYIVRINTHGDVDATCRLMPTTMHYMLKDHYPHFISYEPIPQHKDDWEISRSAASKQARVNTPNILGELLTASLEFGIAHDVKRYISLTTSIRGNDLYKLLITRIGWDSKPMGELLATPDDMSYALKHSVSFDMLERFQKKHNFTEPFLYNFIRDEEGNLTNIEELWHDHSFVRKNQTETCSRTAGIFAGSDFCPVIS